MGKMTFVVDYPDGQEPAVSAATDILGGKLVSAAFKDLTEDNSWRSVTESMPTDSNYVIVHNGDYASIGRFIYDDWWDSDGGGFFIPVTHWMPIPEIE